jgi:hypothetical protein
VKAWPDFLPLRRTYRSFQLNIRAPVHHNEQKKPNSGTSKNRSSGATNKPLQNQNSRPPISLSPSATIGPTIYHPKLSATSPSRKAQFFSHSADRLDSSTNSRSSTPIQYIASLVLSSQCPKTMALLEPSRILLPGLLAG